ncbi:MAG: hypothetical protein MZU97_08895 [Bacillus subtilis]|nr:hypothetical protein [Bacillus subtilis]
MRNIIERAVILSDGEYITAGQLPEKISKSVEEPDTSDIQSSLKACLSDYEKDLLMKTYVAHGRNKEETAMALGIDLATLYRKFKKYGIDGE